MNQAHQQRLGTVCLNLLAAAAYILVAKVGLSLAVSHDHVTPAWPASGLALGAVLTAGLRVLPGLVVGQFLINYLTFCWSPAPTGAMGSVAMSLGIALGGLAEVAFAAYAVRRFAGIDFLNRRKGLLRFILTAVLLSSMLAATVGTLTLTLGDSCQRHDAFTIWMTWWTGDAIGILLLAPFIYAWHNTGLTRTRPAANAPGTLELAALTACLLFGTSAVFGLLQVDGMLGPGRPGAFLSIPILVWAAVRFGIRGATAATVATAGIALFATTESLGPIAIGELSDSLSLLQVFLAVISITSLTLAASTAEQRSAEAALAAANRELEHRVEQRTAELTLVNERLQAMFDHIPVMISHIGADGCLNFVNREFERVLGWSTREACGRNLLADLYPDPVEHERVKQFITQPTSRWGAFEPRGRDGKVVQTLWRQVSFSDGTSIGIGQDMSELHLMHETLRRQNTLLQAQAETTVEGILAVSADGKVLLANQRFRELWKIPPEAMAGDDALLLKCASEQVADPEGFLALIAHIYTQEDLKWRDELKLLDGRVLERYTAPLIGEGGLRYGRIWYFRDVTELKRTTALLAEWKNRYEAAIHATRQVLYDWDSRTDMVTWSGNCEDMLGYTASEISGGIGPVTELIHPDDRQAFKEEIRRVRESREPFKLEFRLRRKDGSYIYVEDNGRFFRGADGQHARMVGFVVDITDRRLAQQQLQESEERFRTLVANLPGAVYRCEPDEKWTMHYLSDAVEQLTGYPASDFIGNAVRTFADLVSEDDASRINQIMYRAMERREPFQIEYPFRHADGSVRTAFEKGRGVIGPDGKLQYIEGAIFDVTELRRTSEALRRSQELLSAIVEGSEDAILAEDTEGIVRSWNAAAERIFGYAAAEMIGRPITLLLPDELKREAETARCCLQRGERVENLETVRRRKDGKLIDVAITMSPVRDRDGKIIGASKIARDISQRKEAEAALSRQEQLLRQVLQALPVGVVITSATGAVVNSNPALERLWGGVRYVGIDSYSEYKAWWTHSGQRVQPDEWPAARAVRLRQVTRDQRMDIETFDGVRKTISISGAPIIDPAGQLIGAVAVLNDVTERVMAEQQLAESERSARAIVDALTAEMAILDETGTIIAVNASWQKFGQENGLRSANSGIGVNYLQLCDRIDGDDAATARSASEGIRRVFRGEVPEFCLEYPCHSPEKERWFAMRVTRFDAGSGMRVVVTHENITERRTAERLERERAGLREAIKGMEQVLGVVGHELRTPLAALRAISEFLLTDGARATEEWDRFLGDMGQEVDRMAETVNNLLEAARLNSGRARWNWGRFDLRRACEQAIESVRPLVNEAQVKLSLDAAPGACIMTGDEEAVRRLIMNLLSNARKHTEAGHIGVSIKTLPGEVPWAEVSVSDTGSGIAPEVLARVGEAFALNSGVVGSNYVGGTGLGLAICKGIIAAHGGVFDIASRPGEGTTITVRLRADLPAAADGDTVYVGDKEQVGV